MCHEVHLIIDDVKSSWLSQRRQVETILLVKQRIMKSWKPKGSRYCSCSHYSKNCAISNNSWRYLLFIDTLDRALGRINRNRDTQSKTDESKIYEDRKRFRSMDKLYWILLFERSFCKMYLFIYGRLLDSFLTASQYCVNLSQMFEYQKISTPPGKIWIITSQKLLVLSCRNHAGSSASITNGTMRLSYSQLPIQLWKIMWHVTFVFCIV